MKHLLVVRLDSMGDVLICGPAIRALAAGADRVSVLAGPLGAAAARLLPGIDEVLVWSCPWILSPAPPVSAVDVDDLVEQLRRSAIDEAVVLTSYHQSPLPTALLLRLAGVPRVVAASEDYPGSLLDLRLPIPEEAPEPVRMLSIARGAGFDLPPGDDGRLAIRPPAIRPPIASEPAGRYLVVHPGTSAPARSYPAPLWAETVRQLAAAGWPVLVTGSTAEHPLAAEITAGQPPAVRNLAGALELAELAAVLRDAAAVLVANTGPAHLAAAVGTPVVSLFAPVVPASRWAPYGVAVELLGDQQAPCRDSRRTVCPVAGHPCLSGVAPGDLVAAVGRLTSHQPVPEQLAVTR